MNALSMYNIEKVDIEQKIQQKSEMLLYAMVFTLVFEGFLRKLVPPLGTLIFFAKDILCVVGLYYVNKTLLAGSSFTIFEKWKTSVLIFIPSILFTAIIDPILAIFGLKQYLLYMVVGVLMPVAFPAKKIESFKKLVLFVTTLILPTTLVAVLQNSLPATHWLNVSVDGNSLEGFAAAGYLRVSSTFSFTGQYSWFLNLVTPFLAAIVFWPKQKGVVVKRAWLLKIYCGVAAVSFMIGIFITGGRSAVLGCGVSIVLGLILSALKSPGKIVVSALVGLLVFAALYGGIRSVKPEFFAAYEARSSKQDDDSTQSDEIKNRVGGSFLGWTKWVFDQDIASIVFGNGLGVISNGSEKISEYAAYRKDNIGKIDIEGDLPTTFFEGGMYLAIVWNSLRLWAIWYCFKVWRSVKQKDWAVLLSFLLGYVIMNACLGQIGKQPPLNMWLWLTVGAVAVINNYIKYLDSTTLEVNSSEIEADAV